MTDERATGLILRTYPLTETSLIIHWLTREQGRLATVAKGARRPKSPFRGKLDLYFLADFSFLRSRRSQLHTLREIVLRDTHPALRTDIGCLQQAAYGSGLIEKFTETDTPLPGCFQIFSDWLRLLSQPRPPRLGPDRKIHRNRHAPAGLFPDFQRLVASPFATPASPAHRADFRNQTAGRIWARPRSPPNAAECRSEGGASEMDRNRLGGFGAITPQRGSKVRD